MQNELSIAQSMPFWQVGKVSRAASEEVVLKLIKSKCYPVLLYGLEAIALNNVEKKSIDFTAKRFFMKLFRTVNS